MANLEVNEIYSRQTHMENVITQIHERQEEIKTHMDERLTHMDERQTRMENVITEIYERQTHMDERQTHMENVITEISERQEEMHVEILSYIAPLAKNITTMRGRMMNDTTQRLNRARYEENIQTRLLPINSYKSNEVIGNLPRSVEEIHAVTEEDVDRILSELCIGTDGTLASKRELLRRQML